MIQEQFDTVSSYVPYLSFGQKTHQLVNEQLIQPRVETFFAARGVVLYQPLEVKNYISDKDYKVVEFKYFYTCILAEIKKELSSGRISCPVKYEITLDEQVTHKVCAKTQIKYDEILLNKTPIFYFIYIDLKEILAFVRNNISSQNISSQKNSD